MIKKTRKKILQKLSFIGILLLDKKKKLNISSENKKVLISDCEKIGNYIFKTPLIRGLKKSGYHVSVMGSHVTKDLLEADPFIDEAIITKCYRKKSSDILRKTFVALKYRGTFSHYIEPVGSSYLRELLFMRVLSPKRILGCERKKGKKFKIIDVVIKNQGHHIDNSLKLLEKLGIKEKREYHLGVEESSKYDNLYKPKPLVLYNGKASTKSRSINPDTEKRLITFLEKLPYINFKLIERESSLNDLTALINKADAVISVDTGISHMASALKKPIIINKYNSLVAPISPIVIKSSFEPRVISEILESIFLPCNKKKA